MSIRRNAGIFWGAVLLAVLVVFCGTVSAAEKPYTPQPGNPVRKSVLDGLRNWVWENHEVRVVFVVRYLKVAEGWAWAETAPQSPDGAEKYEGLMALLRRTGEGGKVMHVPSGEEDAPPVDGTYFEMLLEEAPGIPRGIFPWERKVN
jgi:hypothetical protein